MNFNGDIIDIENNSDSLISYFSNLVKKYGGLNLAQGIPSIQPSNELLNLLSKYRHYNLHQYAPSQGNTSLLGYLENKYETAKNNAKVLITNGATEAISLLYSYLSSLYTQDFNVATFSPAYESYIHLPRIFKHNLYTYLIDADEYFDENDFRDFFINNEIKLLLLSCPGNPYGKVLSKQKIEFLVNLAEENNAFLILDAVYSDFYFGEDQIFYPINNISKNVFYVNSFSKKFSITGWRLGYFLMHDSHFSKISYIHDYTGLSASSYLQYVLSEFVQLPSSVDYIKMIRQTLANNYFKSVQMLNSAGFYCPNVDGGYFTWCKLPDQYKDSGLQFAKNLYSSKKIAIIPGIHFGSEWDRYIRINLALDSSVFNEGIENLIKFVNK